jgi:hypothetical protein
MSSDGTKKLANKKKNESSTNLFQDAETGPLNCCLRCTAWRKASQEKSLNWWYRSPPAPLGLRFWCSDIFGMTGNVWKCPNSCYVRIFGTFLYINIRTDRTLQICPNMSKDLTNGPNSGQIDKCPDIFWTRVSDTEKLFDFLIMTCSKPSRLRKFPRSWGNCFGHFWAKLDVLGYLCRFLSDCLQVPVFQYLCSVVLDDVHAIIVLCQHVTNWFQFARGWFARVDKRTTTLKQ